MINLKLRFDNPGEFLACCGLFYLSDKLKREGKSTGFFSSQGNFTLNTPLSLDKIFQQLFASRRYQQNDTAIIELPNGEKIQLNWWEKLRALKWGGHNTPHDILDRLFEKVHQIYNFIPSNLFHRTDVTTYFGLDARNPLGGEVGYSPRDARRQIAISPVVELLGAIGLQYFSLRWSKDGFHYATWGEEKYSLPLKIAQVASAGLIEPAVFQEFKTTISTVGSVKLLSWATPTPSRV